MLLQYPSVDHNVTIVEKSSSSPHTISVYRPRDARKRAVLVRVIGVQPFEPDCNAHPVKRRIARPHDHLGPVRPRVLEARRGAPKVGRASSVGGRIVTRAGIIYCPSIPPDDEFGAVHTPVQLASQCGRFVPC